MGYGWTHKAVRRRTSNNFWRDPLGRASRAKGRLNSRRRFEDPRNRRVGQAATRERWGKPPPEPAAQSVLPEPEPPPCIIQSVLISSSNAAKSKLSAAACISCDSRASTRASSSAHLALNAKHNWRSLMCASITTVFPHSPAAVVDAKARPLFNKALARGHAARSHWGAPQRLHAAHRDRVSP